MSKEDCEAFEVNLLTYFKFFFTKCFNIQRTSMKYLKMGVDLGLYCIDHETTKTCAEEAKTVVEGLESMSYTEEDFREVYNYLKTTYFKHPNWRIRNQAIFSSGMISTKMCIEIDFESLADDVKDLVYDEELRIRRMSTILFENIFSVQTNKHRATILAEFKEKVEKLKKVHKDQPV